MLQKQWEYESEMTKKCKELMSEIDQIFKPYINIYLDYYEKKILTQDGMLDEIRSLIANLTDEEMTELNELHKMYFTLNCWYVSYDIANIVHELLLEKWYGNYKINYEYIK